MTIIKIKSLGELIVRREGNILCTNMYKVYTYIHEGYKKDTRLCYDFTLIYLDLIILRPMFKIFVYMPLELVDVLKITAATGSLFKSFTPLWVNE